MKKKPENASEVLSVFDIFKIGVGPSSSHTLGPWKAALKFVEDLVKDSLLESVECVTIDLYGSLAKTGSGHGTDLAILMGLSGENPTRCRSGSLPRIGRETEISGRLKLGGLHEIPFDFHTNITYHRIGFIKNHPNEMRLTAVTPVRAFARTYYSIGGGFVVEEGITPKSNAVEPYYPVDSASEIESICDTVGISLAEFSRRNETVFRPNEETDRRLEETIQVMKKCIYDGCHIGGTLPGGLLVQRRARTMSQKLRNSTKKLPENAWFDEVARCGSEFDSILDWVVCFALAVNEENAAYGRVVTAPTNGAAGVIPAVLFYCHCFTYFGSNPELKEFLLVASTVGMLFKKNATISAAMGGCQAEIGVSSAMAAAGLTSIRGGTVGQCFMAAEIAMEHHLGLTCDPIGGLVQVPCIERNSMGAIKAITAAKIALASDPKSAKVSLDEVIRTMWETAKDMNSKYKETSEGGLALEIPLSLPEC